eukprot:GHVS01078443.1.p2 GENE.GHVS01078443.1~~GHVS01078443.1.p2  ORF type:complete len:397 (-),score=56.93 GHVS01078443.1:1996-3186(-)
MERGEVFSGGGVKRLECFVKKTHRGKVRKIVREVYLRDDIGCGLRGCANCSEDTEDSILDVGSALLVLDTNVVLHQIDFITDDPSIDNVVILSTVLQEVRNRNRQSYNRVRSLCRSRKANEEEKDEGEVVETLRGRKFYVFPNEFFADTYVQRIPDETSNDRNDRAIRRAALWYQQHLQLLNAEAEVLLITNDEANKEISLSEGVPAMTVEEYANSVRDRFPLAGEKLASIMAAADKTSTAADKTSTYDAHLTASGITTRLREKSIIRGTVRMIRHDKGFVSTRRDIAGIVEPEEILLEGRDSVNRAVDGDVVAVEIIAENRSTGKVVGIIKRNWTEYYGSLQPLPTGKDQSAFVKTERIFEPFSASIPWISIKASLTSAPRGVDMRMCRPGNRRI